MLKHVIFKILIYILLVAIPNTMFAAQEEEDKEYDPLYTMQALNMAIVTVHTIVSSGDRVVLTQEYDKIKDKLQLGNIKSDASIRRIYTTLMDAITEKKINQKTRSRLEAKYNRKEQKAMIGALSGIRAYGADPWSFLGSLAISCVSQYFAYQDNKEELKNELEDSEWVLEEKDIRTYNKLQTELLNASWKLHDQYHLPDDYRLTQDSLDEYYKAISSSDVEKRLRILKRKESDFKVYPPYWMYRAKAAQDCNNIEEAKMSYDKFDEVWRPVLRKDPYKQIVLKYRITEQIKNKPIDKERINALLKDLREYTNDNDWSNNIFIGLVYYYIQEKDKGIDSVLANIDSEYETELSEEIIKQMKKGNLDFSNTELAGLLQEENEEKISQEYQDMLDLLHK